MVRRVHQHSLVAVGEEYHDTIEGCDIIYCRNIIACLSGGIKLEWHSRKRSLCDFTMSALIPGLVKVPCGNGACILAYWYR